MPSEDEQEIMNEVNEMDGNVKISKDVRGYDDNDKDSKDDEEMNADSDDGSDARKLSHKRKGTESIDPQGVDKYTKPLRETHSKYLQYLRDIEIDKKQNKFTV